jgi:hypothetical protein
MSIYEYIGIAWVVFTVCIGHAALIWFLLAGRNRLKQRLEVGSMAEDAAIRDYRSINSVGIRQRTQ